MENKTPKKGYAIAGFVTSIASCVLGMETWYLGVAAGVVALVLSILAKKSYEEAGQTSGFATAGFIISIVGLGLSALGLVMCLSCGGCASASLAGLMTGDFTLDQANNALNKAGDVLDNAGDAIDSAANILESIADSIG